MRSTRTTRAVAGLTLAALLLCYGCATSAQLTAYRSLAATANAVDVSMSVYGELVRAGKVPAATQATVKKAYEDYQVAMQLAHAAVNIWIAAGAKGPLPASVTVAIDRAAAVQVAAKVSP